MTASVGDFWRAHRCGCMRSHTGTPSESLHWKSTVEEKSLVAPWSRIRVSSVRYQILSCRALDLLPAHTQKKWLHTPTVCWRFGACQSIVQPCVDSRSSLSTCQTLILANPYSSSPPWGEREREKKKPTTMHAGFPTNANNLPEECHPLHAQMHAIRVNIILQLTASSCIHASVSF